MIYTNKEYLPAITITQVLKLNTRLGVKSISVFQGGTKNDNFMIRSNVNIECVYRWHQARTAHGVLQRK